MTKQPKIQFIVCGWWYDEWDGKKNQTEFIDALYELKEENELIVWGIVEYVIKKV